jgi:putative membrane protein
VRFIGWIIAVPVALIVIAFAIANRAPVGVHFDPLPYELDIPLWAAVIGALAFGFLLGALIRWLFDQRWRSEARHGRRHIRALEREISTLRSRLDHPPEAPGEAEKGDAARRRIAPPRDVA